MHLINQSNNKADKPQPHKNYTYCRHMW